MESPPAMPEQLIITHRLFLYRSFRQQADLLEMKRPEARHGPLQANLQASR